MDEYNERANNILYRLREMNVDQRERNTQSKQTNDYLSRVQHLIDTAKQAGQQRHQPLKHKMDQLRRGIDSHANQVNVMRDAETIGAIKRMETNIKQNISRHQKEQVLVERGLRNRMNECLREMEEQGDNSGRHKTEELERYKTMVETQLPELLREVRQHRHSKDTLNPKSVTQVADRLEKLRRSIDEETSMRVQDQQESMAQIRHINEDFKSLLKREQLLIQEEELSLCRLVDTILSKLRHQVINQK